MARGDLPFDFSTQATQRPDVDPYTSTANQWASFLDQPGARAALLNAGIALMQPPSFGDTFASQLGRAIGAGAEAATKGEVLEHKYGESEAKQELAGARIGQAADRLSLEQLKRASIEKVAQQGREISAFKLYVKDQADVKKAYANQKKEIDKANEIRTSKDQLPYPPPPPEMDYPTWLRTRGAALISGGTVGAPSTVAKPPAETTEEEP